MILNGNDITEQSMRCKQITNGMTVHYNEMTADEHSILANTYEMQGNCVGMHIYRLDRNKHVHESNANEMSINDDAVPVHCNENKCMSAGLVSK